MKKDNILVFTFVEAENGFVVSDMYNVISANIGTIVNGQFKIKHQLQMPENLLAYDEFHLEQIKEFEGYLNETWKNKGLMLMDVRGNNLLKEKLSKVLVNAHKAVGNTIGRVVCGVSSREELRVWEKQQTQNDLKKMREDMEENGEHLW